MGEKLVILSTERAMMSVSSILFRTHHKGCRTPLALASYENPPPKAGLRSYLNSDIDSPKRRSRVKEDEVGMNQ